ncbi:MAG: ATP synthase F0 subunit B [bacterium]|nr:ATP synthase F0 subunit B [bacterium]
MDTILSVMKAMNSEPIMVLVQVGLFYVFHMMMSQILYKPMIKARRERRALTIDNILAAWKLNEETITTKREYEEKIRLAKQEALEKVQAAQKKVEHLRQERLETGRVESESIIEEARADIAAAQGLTTAELEARVPHLALQMAGRILLSVTYGVERDRLQADFRREGLR